MELFIHAGLNKTGSSFIQCVFHANSDILSDSGIAYKGGSPTAGNANELSIALRARDQAKAARFLGKHVAHARARGKERVLLSAEYLYHDMVVPEHLELLRTLVADSGFKRINVLLFFRDPVAHAISAYCHRSGRQDLGPFDQWIELLYEFPGELRQFLATIKETPEINWCTYAYSKSGLVEAVCEWLSIDALPTAVSREVNVSVSVDEAEILARLRVNDARAAVALRQALKAIPRDRKGDDSAQRARYRAIAENALFQLNPELEKLSSLVSTRMTVPSPAKPMTEAAHWDAVTLSSDQIDALLRLCRAPKARVNFGRLSQGVRRRLGRVARNLRT